MRCAFSKVPAALTEEAESELEKRQAQKKREKKAKRRQKEKEKKAVEDEKVAEAEERQQYLALSDREKVCYNAKRVCTVLAKLAFGGWLVWELLPLWSSL